MSVTTIDFKAAGRVLETAKQKYADLIHRGSLDKTDALICGGLALSAFGPRGFFLALLGVGLSKLQNAWQDAQPAELYKGLVISYCSLALAGCAPGLISCPVFFETYALADKIKEHVRFTGISERICSPYTTGIPIPYSRIDGFRIPASTEGWKWGGEVRTLCVTVAYVEGEFSYFNDIYPSNPVNRDKPLEFRNPKPQPSSPSAPRAG